MTTVTRKNCCPQQVVFRKPVDYSKLADYSKPADYSKLVDYSKVAVYKCKPADYSKAAVYKCKLAVYKCKPEVYTCKVLNSRFTTVLLITLLDTVELTPFFQFFFVKQWFTCVNQWFTGVNCCFTVNHHFTSCKLLLYCKPPLYKF